MERTFQNCMLPKGTLMEGMVPGLDTKDIKKLKQNLVITVDHLVSKLFEVDRDEKEFVNYLTGLGIVRENAEECALNLWKKFVGI